MGRSEPKEESVRKEEWVREGGNGLLQSEFLFLSNFMVETYIYIYIYINIIKCLRMRIIIETFLKKKIASRCMKG